MIILNIYIRNFDNYDDTVFYSLLKELKINKIPVCILDIFNFSIKKGYSDEKLKTYAI